MSKTSERGRSAFYGWRWQSRHHSILRDAAWRMSGILSTRPWQETQPTPLAMWMLWSKYTKSGRSFTRDQRSGWPVRKLARTGSSIGLSFQIVLWQFMQVAVGGMPAKAVVSTEVWQYRQSRPSPET